MVNRAISSPDATNGQLAMTYIKTAAQADSWKLTWQALAGIIHGRSRVEYHWECGFKIWTTETSPSNNKVSKIQTQIIKK